MASKALTVRLELEGARQTLAAFRKLPKEASEQLREASGQLAQLLASRARAAGAADSGQSAIVAATIKTRRDRVPSIVVGGATRIGRNSAPAYKVLFGSEFGSNRLKQFRPHLGRQGYWFFPTVEENQRDISDSWGRVADDIVRTFSAGGGR